MMLVNALWVVFVTIGVCSLGSLLIVLLGEIVASFQPLPDDRDKAPKTTPPEGEKANG